MARSRRRRRNRLYTLLTLAIVVVGAGTYYRVFWKPISDASGGADDSAARLISEPPRADSGSASTNHGRVDRAIESSVVPNPVQPEQNRARAEQLMRDGFAALNRGAIIDARAKLSEALILPLSAEDTTKTRAALSKLSDDTLFSTAITPHDPYVSAYVIQSGERLVTIAKRFDVTDDLLARINRIPDKDRVRAGQRIKVLHGPFHAVIDRNTFDMDVYLQNTFIKHFRVGLGADSSTPSGKWKVHNKLMNPTYYPPRGGKIIAANDPANPLGERWIGLEGVEGDAVGQERYGVHGTNEPESVGRNMSMGCVRMRNSDVEFLYDLLVEGKSAVVIR